MSRRRPKLWRPPKPRKKRSLFDFETYAIKPPYKISKKTLKKVSKFIRDWLNRHPNGLDTANWYNRMTWDWPSREDMLPVARRSQ